MISPRAAAAFDRIASVALRGAAPADLDAQVVPASVAPLDGEGRSIVLSISEYTFRLVVFFHFEQDEATLSHVARLCRSEANELSEQQLVDTVCEWANMYCGTINRELGRVFPHVGMSTPNVVERRVVAHVARLRPGHVTHLALRCTGGPSFASTLCVCEHGDIDFEFDATTDAPTEMAGELELF